MKTIAILHGPNLDRLGKREPEVYGHATLADLEDFIRVGARQRGLGTTFFQSASEGALVDKIHALTDEGIAGFIVNFGAYSHTSIALRDALSAAELPAVEVHLSDIKAREPFRHHSMTAGACRAMISGKGFGGYAEALDQITQWL
ncbi:3-dehydroquinate dehydratase [Cephaloticoccus primus]|uniref:3-dehydroquinate dehydratase n=1 Tax=Cephaloticoccus primus TaxID=1548207 RepID=A0A139SLT4_9BACT|nr:type II 3-dehydroquinate dehydratase [Cephaloticoccus primus]KXU35460.1 3-dehydroquinate dehydratase [Cephaloticoccus primus]